MPSAGDVRAVADTNVLPSDLFWRGRPHALMESRAAEPSSGRDCFVAPGAPRNDTTPTWSKSELTRTGFITSSKLDDDGWSDGCALSQCERAFQCVAGDLVLAQEGNPGLTLGIAQELIPGPYHLRRATDAVMRADRHHAAAMAGLLIELIEVHLDLLDELCGRVVSALDQQNVVVAQGRVRQRNPCR